MATANRALKSSQVVNIEDLVAVLGIMAILWSMGMGPEVTTG